MRTMKKMLAIFLACVMAMSLCVSAFAADGDGIAKTLNAASGNFNSDGDYEGDNPDESYNIVLPTATADVFNFILDPHDLIRGTYGKRLGYTKDDFTFDEDGKMTDGPFEMGSYVFFKNAASGDSIATVEIGEGEVAKTYDVYYYETSEDVVDNETTLYAWWKDEDEGFVDMTGVAIEELAGMNLATKLSDGETAKFAQDDTYDPPEGLTIDIENTYTRYSYHPVTTNTTKHEVYWRLDDGSETAGKLYDEEGDALADSWATGITTVEAIEASTNPVLKAKAGTSGITYSSMSDGVKVINKSDVPIGISMKIEVDNEKLDSIDIVEESALATATDPSLYLALKAFNGTEDDTKTELIAKGEDNKYGVELKTAIPTTEGAFDLDYDEDKDEYVNIPKEGLEDDDFEYVEFKLTGALNSTAKWDGKKTTVEMAVTWACAEYEVPEGGGDGDGGDVVAEPTISDGATKGEDGKYTLTTVPSAGGTATVKVKLGKATAVKSVTSGAGAAVTYTAGDAVDGVVEINMTFAKPVRNSKAATIAFEGTETELELVWTF